MTLSRSRPRTGATELEAWRRMRGITHLCVSTAGMGLATPDDHVKTLRRFRETVGLD
mgnify:CR=1 FL=1